MAKKVAFRTKRGKQVSFTSRDHYSDIVLGSVSIIILILGWALVASAGLNYLMQIIPDDTLTVFIVGVILIATSVVLAIQRKRK